MTALVIPAGAAHGQTTAGAARPSPTTPALERGSTLTLHSCAPANA